MSRRVSIFGSSFASVSFLLDNPAIASGIAAPFALFRLKSGYTGPIVDVRRTVGATTTIVSVGLGSGSQFTLDALVTGVVTGSSSATNLGEFVAAAGYADPDSLGSAQDWFYTKGYNQNSGTQVWVQLSATSQPRGGTAGVMAMRNGRAEMAFDGINDWCDFGLIGGATKPINYSVLAVAAFDSPLNQRRAICASIPDANLSVETWGVIFNRNTTPGRLESQYGDGVGFYAETSNATVFTQNQQALVEQYKQQGVTGVSVYTDGSPRAMTTFGGAAVDTGGTNHAFRVGRFGDGGFSAFLQGGIQFIGVWTTNKESERLAIKEKLNEILGTTW